MNFEYDTDPGFTTSVQTTAVATYLRQWKPNAAPVVAPNVVTKLREATASRSAPWTAAELRTAEGQR